LRSQTGSKSVSEELFDSLRLFLRRETDHAPRPYCLIEQLRRWGAGSDLQAAIEGQSPRQQVETLVGLARRAFETDIGDVRTEIERNLRHDNSLRSASTLAKRMRSHAEFLFVSLLDPVILADDAARADAMTRVELLGQRHAQAALSSGMGAIFMSCHQTHTAFGLRHLQAGNSRFTVVRNPSDAEVYPAGWVERGYGPYVELVPATIAGAGRLLGALEAGYFAALHGDFSYPETLAVPGSLFGRPVLFSRSLMRLILRSRVPVYPASVVRLQPFTSRRVRVEVFPPLPLADLSDSKPDCLRAALRLSVAIECLIRRHPVQWAHWTLLEHRWQQAALHGMTVPNFARRLVDSPPREA
jgi:lauroyl/myristoyl acyltransferase